MGSEEGGEGLVSQTVAEMSEGGRDNRSRGYWGPLSEGREGRNEKGKEDSRASTSPPRMSLVLPMPVLTTEQYWALLLTTRASRLSM